MIMSLTMMMMIVCSGHPFANLHILKILSNLKLVEVEDVYKVILMIEMMTVIVCSLMVMMMMNMVMMATKVSHLCQIIVHPNNLPTQCQIETERMLTVIIRIIIIIKD